MGRVAPLALGRTSYGRKGPESARRAENDGRGRWCCKWWARCKGGAVTSGCPSRCAARASNSDSSSCATFRTLLTCMFHAPSRGTLFLSWHGPLLGSKNVSAYPWVVAALRRTWHIHGTAVTRFANIRRRRWCGMVVPHDWTGEVEKLPKKVTITADETMSYGHPRTETVVVIGVQRKQTTS